MLLIRSDYVLTYFGKHTVSNTYIIISLRMKNEFFVYTCTYVCEYTYMLRKNIFEESIFPLRGNKKQ